jgi:hypothetical protein
MTNFSTTVSNCFRFANTLWPSICFNDMETEWWSGGKDTDMTCATKGLVDIITTGLDFDIGHAHVLWMAASPQMEATWLYTSLCTSVLPLLRFW